MDLSQSLVRSLLESTAEFPVDFDDAWRWIGYKKKQNGKDKLIRNFAQGVDYTVTQMRETKPDGSFSHQWEKIELSIDCFKSLAMMAGTDKGREVRQYFLDCERNLKQSAKAIEAQAEEIEKLRLQLQLTRARERLMAAAEMLSQTAPQLVTAIICPEITVVERLEVKEVTVTVDSQGRTLAQYDGLSITQLAKRYGFGTGKKATDACRAWLLSLGIKQDDWVAEPAAHLTWKLPREVLKKLDSDFLIKGGDRQKLIGEW